MAEVKTSNSASIFLLVLVSNDDPCGPLKTFGRLFFSILLSTFFSSRILTGNVSLLNLDLGLSLSASDGS